MCTPTPAGFPQGLKLSAAQVTGGPLGLSPEVSDSAAWGPEGALVHFQGILILLLSAYKLRKSNHRPKTRVSLLLLVLSCILLERDAKVSEQRECWEKLSLWTGPGQHC